MKRYRSTTDWFARVDVGEHDALEHADRDPADDRHRQRMHAGDERDDERAQQERRARSRRAPAATMLPGVTPEQRRDEDRR